jgi:hypothetical protein
VHKGVAHGTKAAAKIARELLSAKPGRGMQNSVVGPAVVLVEPPNVVGSHSGRQQVPSIALEILAHGVLADTWRSGGFSLGLGRIRVTFHCPSIGGVAERPISYGFGIVEL